MKITAKELKQNQKQLCDGFIKNPEQIDAIMKQYTNFNGELVDAGFHKYTIRNFILAYGQMYARNKNGVELLAPYKRWNKVHRFVKKGEKALYVLAPMKKKIKEADENNDAEYITYFKKVPVFDISQTDGEKICDNYITGESAVGFKEMVERIPFKVEYSNTVLKEGETDGKTITISNKNSETEKICVLFHELAHTQLHFNNDKNARGVEELEAETVSYICCSALGIRNEKSGAYIKGWYEDNPANEIVGRSNRLIKCSEDLLKMVGVM